jgi:SAM-dependent methyltransferase
VLSLGAQPLANALLSSQAEWADEDTYPLDLYVCRDCFLVQLLDVIDPSLLFEHYLYVSGTSDTMAAHHAAYAASLVSDHGLGADDLVVEIASNDGTLLAEFAKQGTRTMGIEPARNIADMARARGVETISEFFGEALGRRLHAERGPASAVVANNVLAHVDDTKDLLRGMAALVADRGVVVVEVPYVAEMIERLEYDTIYHEHLCYFSVTSLMALYRASGLSITRVDEVPVHGGSLRVHARSAVVVPEHDDAVVAMAAREAEAGLSSLERYRRFATDVQASRAKLRALLEELRGGGHTLAAYGAPAKGNTLLNYCGIGPDLVEYTVDKNPLKVGRYTPGMHLSVLPAEVLAERRPDYVLILAWNFAEEIQRQQEAYVRGGGRFVVPLPEPRVL